MLFAKQTKNKQMGMKVDPTATGVGCHESRLLYPFPHAHARVRQKYFLRESREERKVKVKPKRSNCLFCPYTTWD